MRSSSVTLAPDRQLPTNSGGYPVEELESVVFAPESDNDAGDSLPERSVGANRLPIFVFIVGFGIYFASIAAFTSFPGVAVGVFVIVIGAMIYACRGLGRAGGEYRANDASSHLLVGEVTLYTYDRSSDPEQVLVGECPGMPPRVTNETLSAMNRGVDSTAVRTPA